MVQKSRDLNGYVQFIDRIKQNTSDGLSLYEAITEAVTYCLSNGILIDFLENHGSEVLNMLIDAEFNIDEAREVWKEEAREEGLREGLREGLQKGLHDGLQKGMRDGRKQEKFDLAKILLADNVYIDKIIQYTGLTKKEIQKLIQ